MADFDVKAARAAGYSDDEIGKIVNGIKAARAAGYSDDEITSHLTGTTMQSRAVSGNPSPSMPRGTSASTSPDPLSASMATIGRQSGIIGTGMVEGAINTLALPDRLGELALNALPNNVTNAFGAIAKPFIDLSKSVPSWTTTPIVPQIANAARNAGLIDNPNYAPTGVAENIESGGAKGLGGALLTAPFGGVGVGVRTLLGGTLGGIAGEAAHQAVPTGPGSTILPILAGATTAIGGSTLADILAGNRLEGVAKQLGSSTTMQQAGGELQDAVRDWKSNVLPMKLGAAASPLDAKMAHNPTVNFNNFDKTLNDITTEGGTTQPLIDMISSRLPGQLQKTMSSLPGTIYGGPTGSHYVIPAVPYEDARVLSSRLGDLIVNPKLIPGNDVNVVKQLYKSLRTDIGETATANGAGDEWNSFNKEASRLYSIAEGPMSKVATDINPVNDILNPEDVATKLMSAGKRGASDLAALRGEVPDAVNELAAAHLRSSPQLWPKLSSEAQEALVPNPSHRAIIDYAHSTPSSPVTSLRHGAEALIGERVGELAAHALNLFPGTPELPGLVGIAAPAVARGLKNVLTNPSRLPYPAVGAVAGNASNPIIGGGTRQGGL